LIVIGTNLKVLTVYPTKLLIDCVMLTTESSTQSSPRPSGTRKEKELTKRSPPSKGRG